MDFDRKVVLVTGASSGIGRAAAVLFAARGARVVAAGRDEAALAQTAARCGPEARTVVADLGTDEGVRLLAERALELFGRLDVLVNNAGIGARCTLQNSDMETFDRVFNIHVRAVYQLSQLLAPALIETKGCIINVSSVAGNTVYTGTLPYSMAKAAMNHFTDLIALELAPKGVRVNTVSPGITESNFVKRVTGCSEEQYEEYLKNSVNMIPLGRVCSPEDVAGAIVYLASPAASIITGANIVVDGGTRFVASTFGNQVLEKQGQNS